jgi:hypothetical protein
MIIMPEALIRLLANFAKEPTLHALFANLD